MKKTTVLLFVILCASVLNADIKKWNYHGASLTGSYCNSFNNIYVYQSIDYLKSLGVDSIALIVNWYQDDYNTTHIYSDVQKTIEDADLIQVIEYCRQKGIKVNLKPHLDLFPLNDDYTKWRALIKPDDIPVWFAEFEKFVFHYLDIAIRHDVDIFTIATEMVSMTRPEYHKYWEKIITNIKHTSYKGLITYCADKTETFGSKALGKDFWTLFDIISLSAYYSSGLSWNMIPDYALLEKEWLKWKNDLEIWKRGLGLNKKVLISEIGYRSIDYTHKAPYQTFGPIAKDNYNSNEKLQADCFRAMLNALDKIRWMDGLFFWVETIHSPPEYYTPENLSYSIINKEASLAVQEFYDKEGNRPPDILSAGDTVCGNWYYYLDEGNKSKIIFNNRETLIFKYIIKEMDGILKQVSPLNGTVTGLYSPAYIAAGINLSAGAREKIKSARGIRFKVISSTNRLLCLIESSSQGYVCYKMPLSLRPGKVQEFEVFFSDLVPWDSYTAPFNKNTVGDISFRTDSAPLDDVKVEIFDLKFIF